MRKKLLKLKGSQLLCMQSLLYFCNGVKFNGDFKQGVTKKMFEKLKRFDLKEKLGITVLDR